VYITFANRTYGVIGNEFPKVGMKSTMKARLNDALPLNPNQLPNMNEWFFANGT